MSLSITRFRTTGARSESIRRILMHFDRVIRADLGFRNEKENPKFTI